MRSYEKHRSILMSVVVAAGLSLGSGCVALESEGEGEGEVDDLADVEHEHELGLDPVNPEAFPGRLGEPELLRVERPGGATEIEVQRIDGYAVFQGDIIVETPEAAARRQGRSNVGLPMGRPWTDGIVPYTLDPSLTHTDRVLTAIHRWERSTSVRFVERTTEPDFVTFSNGAGCDSAIGMIGGQQHVHLRNPHPTNPNVGFCNVGSAMHEIGHLLGLEHEHSRLDRDDHLLVNLANVLPGRAANFDKTGAGVGPFDFGSIMLYSSDAFSVDTLNRGLATTRPTMVKKADGSKFLAQRERLSATDGAGVRWFYQHNPKDHTGDGKMDLIWHNPFTGQVEIDALSATTVAQVIQVPTAGSDSLWHVEATGDFDSDDRQDLFWRHELTGETRVTVMTRDGSTLATLPLPTVNDIQWQPMLSGDLDGDGDDDLLWRHAAAGIVSIWYLENGEFQSYQELPMSTDWRLEGIGDIDANGVAEVIWRNHTGPWFKQGVIRAWVFSGQAMTERTVGVQPTYHSFEGTGDFNKDGTADLLWRRTSSGDVSMWPMLASGSAGAPVTIHAGVGADWQIEHVGDTDHDGDADIVWQNLADQRLSLWVVENGALAAWGEPKTRPAPWRLVSSR